MQNLLKFAAVVLVVGSVVFWHYEGSIFESEEADNNAAIEVVEGVQ